MTTPRPADLSAQLVAAAEDGDSGPRRRGDFEGRVDMAMFDEKITEEQAQFVVMSRLTGLVPEMYQLALDLIAADDEENSKGDEYHIRNRVSELADRARVIRDRVES